MGAPTSEIRALFAGSTTSMGTRFTPDGERLFVVYSTGEGFRWDVEASVWQTARSTSPRGDRGRGSFHAPRRSTPAALGGTGAGSHTGGELPMAAGG